MFFVKAGKNSMQIDGKHPLVLSRTQNKAAESTVKELMGLYVPAVKPGETTRYFHYTTPDVAIKILKPILLKSATSATSTLDVTNYYHTLYASNISFLNDEKEYHDGSEFIYNHLIRKRPKGYDYQLFKKCLNAYYARDVSLKNNRLFDAYYGDYLANSEVFATCFCTNGNLLGQWKYYGGESGIAIELGIEGCRFSGHVWDSATQKVNDEETGITQPYRVIYLKDEKDKVLRKCYEFRLKKLLARGYGYDDIRPIMGELDNLQRIAPLFKDESFKDELEARLLFRPVFNPSGTRPNYDDGRGLILHRFNAGRIVPYMEMKLYEYNDKLNNIYNGLIKSVTIGPGMNQEVIYQGMIHFLLDAFSAPAFNDRAVDLIPESHDETHCVIVKGIKVRCSTVPFRW